MGMTFFVTQALRNNELSTVLAALGGVIRVHMGDEPDGKAQLFCMGRAQSLVFEDQWLDKFDAHNWEQFSSWATTPQGAAHVVHLGSMIYGSTWDGGPQLAPELTAMLPTTFLDILRVIVADIADRFEKDLNLSSLVRSSWPMAFAILRQVASNIHEVPVDQLDNDTLFVETRRLAQDRTAASTVELWALRYDGDFVARGARYLRQFHEHTHGDGDGPDTTDIPKEVQVVFQSWSHQMSAT